MNNLSSTYTPFQQYLRECFSVAFKFADKYKDTKTDEEWERLAEEAGKYTDPLTIELITAAIMAIEKEHKNAGGINLD